MTLILYFSAATLLTCSGLLSSRGCRVVAPRRAVSRLFSSDDLEEEPRLYEVCRLDAAGEIVECHVVDAEELAALGHVGAKRESDDESELFFTMPSSSGGDETVFSVADFTACFAEGLCDVPPDVLNKAFGPDAVEMMMRNATAPEHASTTVPSTRDARFHLHFGAGRLGLGLVVPAIASSGLPFAVVQRPKPRWQEIFASGARANHVDMEVNHEVKVRNARVVSTVDGEPAAPATTPAQSLVFGSSPEALKNVVGKATSFSCSLGSAMISVMTSTLEGVLPEIITHAELDAALATVRRQQRMAARSRAGSSSQSQETLFADDLDPAVDPRPVLYCTENDHAAVAKLKLALRTRVRVVDCMVDRVCMGRVIEADGVNIEAEPWRGAIVVLEPGFTQRQVPFAPDYVSLPRTATEADFYSKRKFSLVNGMHTVLAFMTLDALYSPMARNEYVLVKYAELRRNAQRDVEAWRAARCAELLDEFGAEAIAEWSLSSSSRSGSDGPVSGADADASSRPPRREDAWDALLDFADEVLLDRFSKVDDLVSRVLGGGVANRYQQRLAPTTEWMRRRATTAPQDDELTAFFAYAAKRDRARAERSVLDNVVCDPESDTCELVPDDELESPFASNANAEHFVLQACQGLLKNAKRFCNKELEITHKDLIKEQRASGGKKFSKTVQEALKAEKDRNLKVEADRNKRRQQLV